MSIFLSYREARRIQNSHKLIGGKASALVKLSEAGHLIPDGFIATARLFNRYIDKGEGMTDAGNERSFVRSIKFSGEVRAGITEYVGEYITTEDVAVRSSALAEDSSSRSFAGQFESYLNVKKRDIAESIKKCWLSLYSKRVSEYMKNTKMEEDQGEMGVLIQEMINPVISGVVFSAHPVINDTSMIVIEAVSGSNEALVQGTVNPSCYVIDKCLNLLEKKEGGDCQGKDRLEKKQIYEIAKKAIEIEKLFGHPIDIEWAIRRGDLYILQCRPITTLG